MKRAMTKLTFAPGDVRRVVQHMAAATEWSQSPFEKDERGAKPHPQLLFVHDDGVYVMSNGKPRDIVSEDRTFCAYATGFDPDKDGNVWGRARDAVGDGDFVEWLDFSAQQIALVLSDDFAGMMIDVSADGLEVICLTADDFR